MKQVQKETKSLSGFVQKNSTRFRKMGMAMTVAGGAIVGSLALMVKGYVKAGDEVHKMALRTGFATETLSELRHAAAISGADLSSLEKGVKRMAKTIVDAGDGMATYIRAFDRIGVSVDDLKKMNPEQQFLEIAEAIGAVEDPTIRAASAQDIFGRAGTQLLPLFAAGKEGMKELREEAHRLGIVFDQEAADKAAKLADAQTSLKHAMQGLTMTIAENIVPVVNKLVDGITSMIVKVKDWAKENPELSKTLVKIAAALGGLMLVLGPLVMILPGLVTGVGLLGTAFTTMLGPAGLVALAIMGVALAIKELVKQHGDAITAIKNFNKEIQAEMLTGEQFATVWAKATEKGGEALEEWEDLTERFKGNWTDTFRAILTEPQYDKLKEILEEIIKTESGLLDIGEDINDVNIKRTKSTAALSNSLLTLAEMNERVLEIEQQILIAEGERLRLQQLEFVASQELAEGEKSRADTSVEGSNKMLDGFRSIIPIIDAVKQAELDAAGTAIRAAETRAAGMSMVFNAAKGLLGQLAGKSKLAAIALAIINTAEGVTKALSAAPPPFNIALAAITAAAGMAQIATIRSTPVPSFAEGGRIEDVGLVGERGPELFFPERPGTIVPMGKQGMTTNTINFAPVFNISNLDPMTTRDVVRQQILPQMIQALKNKIGLTDMQEALGV